MSKELRDIENAVDAYCKKHKNNVVFNACFYAFNKKGDVIDERCMSYGTKTCLIIDLKEHLKMIRKEKEEFVNW